MSTRTSQSDDFEAALASLGPADPVKEPTKSLPGGYEAMVAARGRDAVMVQGVPIEPANAGDRLHFMTPEPTPTLAAHDVELVFEDSREDATPIRDVCRCHRWFMADDGSEWQARPMRLTETRRRPARGERYVMSTMYSQMGEQVTRYVATRADRRGHLEDLAHAAHLAAHPELGDYFFVADVPPGWPADVREILGQWRDRTIRPVVNGEHLALSAAGGASWAAVISPDDETVVREYGTLLLAELGGRTLPCSVPDCPSPARAMAKVATPICLEHLALPVGGQPVVEQPVAPKSGIRAALGSALASAIGA
jgi:hypothetical protein